MKPEGEDELKKLATAFFFFYLNIFKLTAHTSVGPFFSLKAAAGDLLQLFHAVNFHH